MKDLRIPIPELRKLEPLLAEYYGYRRAIFSSELLSAYHAYYPNGVGRDISVNYQIPAPYFDEYGVDDGALDYHRHAPRPASTSTQFDAVSFIMDTEHKVLITLSNEKILTEIQKLLEKYGMAKDDEFIGISLLIVAAIYDKYVKGELYTETTISENTLPYLQQVRPEMLRLYELLNTKRYSPSKKQESRVLHPITIDNGVNKVTLNNSCYWLTDLLDNYLNIYLGVNSLEEAQAELDEKYSERKGRKTNNMACNLVMYGTFHLLKNHTSLKTKGEQLSMTLDYLDLLFEADSFNNDENSANASIAYLVKQGYKPLWKPKEMEDYNTSPNNYSTQYLW